MDRRLILAVAGSGKTTYLIKLINLEKSFLIVTYTENNLYNIRRRIINKFGYMPNNITIMTYFKFLIHVCYRPFLKDEIKAKGITWNIPENYTRYMKGKLYYMTKNGFLYYNRLSKLCQTYCAKDIKERIEKFYDCYMFDEIQDLGGHDFDFIQNILPTNIDCILVGDFYQHTFETSNDGNIATGLYKDYTKYKKKWSKTRIEIDEKTLSNSYRCSPTICNFVSQHLGIKIASHRHDNSAIHIINKQDEADKLFRDDSKVKLFYKEAQKYPCISENWGNSKGLDSFQNICIVLNKTTLKAFNENKLNQLPQSTLNKFYVACTRAKGDIYFIPHTFIDQYKRQTM